AAKYGLVRRREISTSHGPSAGPCSSAKRPIVSTGRAPLPANAEPNQSRNRSSARRTTGAGRSSKRRLAAKFASAREGWSFIASARLPVAEGAHRLGDDLAAGIGDVSLAETHRSPAAGGAPGGSEPAR